MAAAMAEGGAEEQCQGQFHRRVFVLRAGTLGFLVGRMGLITAPAYRATVLYKALDSGSIGFSTLSGCGLGLDV